MAHIAAMNMKSAALQAWMPGWAISVIAIPAMSMLPLAPSVVIEGIVAASRSI
jgi:hypothetical protein